MSTNREQRIASTFVELADTLVEDFDVIDFLQQMTVRCRQLLDVTDTAVFLDHPGPRLHAAAPCDPSSALQLILHAACQEGPAADAHHTGRPVTTHDLADAELLWPHFVPRLRNAGYVHATAVPMRLRQESVGSLLLLNTGHQPLGADDLALAQAFADTATIGLIQARTIRQEHALNEQLHTALQSRIVIEQAKGILAARRSSTLNQAFESMRHHARRHRLLLSRVARDVIDLGLMPPPVPDRLGTSTTDTE